MRKRLKEGEKYFWFSVRRERKKGGKVRREEGGGERREEEWDGLLLPW